MTPGVMCYCLVYDWLINYACFTWTVLVNLMFILICHTLDLYLSYKYFYYKVKMDSYIVLVLKNI